MESEWRYNVAEQGFAFGEIALLARLVGPGLAWVWRWNFAPGGGIGFVGESPFTGQLQLFPISYLTGTFPFGWDVEPD